MRAKIMVLAMAVLALALGACGSGEDRPGQASAGRCGGESGSASVSGSGTGEELAFDEDEADTEVKMTLQDYAFVDLPPTVKGPKVFFEAEVEGSNCHELEVLDAGGDAVGEIKAFPAGETKHLALELQPGTYTVQCLVKEGAKTHADLGMKTTLTVE